MRGGGRESVLSGIALLCLDISAAIAVVAWDVVQQLAGLGCRKATRAIRRLFVVTSGFQIPFEPPGANEVLSGAATNFTATGGALPNRGQPRTTPRG
jgi:hypothetical protein